MRTRDRIWPWATLIGVVVAGISLVRLWLGNSLALTQNLWAEDGLFPLCIDKADFFTCMSDPFAGYFLFLPRLLAWPVSMLPWELWALAANLIAALVAGLIAALIVVILQGAGLTWYVTIAIALLPVLAPMSGLEAINTIASSYMLLLFASTLAVLFVPQRGRGWTVLVSVLLFITALTIPSAVLILVVLAVQASRHILHRSTAAVWTGALFVGLTAQAVVALTAARPRQIELTGESLQAWADSVPVSLLTYWPGLSIGEYSFFTNFSLSPLSWTGWLSVAVISIVGLARVVTGWRSGQSTSAPIGLLLLAGLVFGLIPSVIGYTNNRYFVVPLLLWGAAVLVWLDPVIRRSRWWVITLVTVGVVLVWWPAIPVSEYRSAPAPFWQDEVARIEAKCLSDPAFIDRPLFTPFWPPNWGDGLEEPTHPDLPCSTVLKWIQ